MREKNDQSGYILDLESSPDHGMTNAIMEDEEAKEAPGYSRPPSGSACMIKREITTTVSYMEIYNENVNDLLDEKKRNLEVRDHKGEVIVEHLTSRTVRSLEDMERLLELGEEVRKIAATKCNVKSTRSHTVFRINIEIDD